EDGIRDIGVTGVQTCALPIWRRWRTSADSLREGDGAAADRLHERVDRRLRRANDAQAALAVEVGPRRVEDADDDAPDVEALLGDLADEDVRVVAVGGRDDRVGVLDPRLAQHVDVDALPHE